MIVDTARVMRRARGPPEDPLGHTTLPLPGKKNTKLQLRDFAVHQLQQQLNTHVLLRGLLEARLTAWIGELDQLADAPAAPGKKPDFDSFVVPALVQQNKEAANDYFSAVGILSLALAEEVPGAMQIEIAETVAAKKAIMVGANTAYELGEISYDKAVRDWEAQASEHPRLSGEYQKAIGLLRARLVPMVQTFNDRSRFDEDLEPEDVGYFASFYENYVPTHSFYNGAAGGTLYYDFQNNRFQLHIHCAVNAVKAKAVRIKRYGDEYGTKRDGAWGMVEHFMQNYPPNWTGRLQRV